MIYERSDTALDAVSQFTPESFPAAHRRRGMAGWFDDLFSSSAPTVESGDYPATSGGFSFDNLINQVGQVYTTVTQAELARDLYQLNLERAQRGLAPIPASQLAPQMNVGVAADTQRTIMMVLLGGAAILGASYIFGSRRRSRR